MKGNFWLFKTFHQLFPSQIDRLLLFSQMIDSTLSDPPLIVRQEQIKVTYGSQLILCFSLLDLKT